MQPNELCHLAARWTGAVPEHGIMCEQKVDGWRALYFRGRDGKPGLWTRGGHSIGGVGHILHRLALMEQAAGQPLFVDGEFQVDGTLAATKAHCERGHKFAEAGTFHAFDCLTEAEWRANDCHRPLVQRKAMLASLKAASEQGDDAWGWRAGTHGKEPDGPPIALAQDEWCFDRADVDAAANRVWMAGGEGLMLKDAESVYRRERSKAWLKVKHPHYVPGVGVNWNKAA